jgi:hypothetical protein
VRVLGRAHDRRLPACQATTPIVSATSPAARSARPIPCFHRVYLGSALRSPPLRVLCTLRRSTPHGETPSFRNVSCGVPSLCDECTNPCFPHERVSQALSPGRHYRASPYHGFFLWCSRYDTTATQGTAEVFLCAPVAGGAYPKRIPGLRAPVTSSPGIVHCGGVPLTGRLRLSAT